MILTIVMELSRRDAFREIVERLSGLMVEAGKADSARDRRRLLALFGHGAMSDLSLLCAAKRTSPAKTVKK
jgi:hypothetical protein